MPAPTVILDVDGTLVDSNDAHARAWADAFAEAGVEVAFDSIRRAIGMGGDKLLPHVAGISEDSALGARLSTRRGEIFKARYLAGIQPFPGVRLLLERFARDGFTVVVASSASKDDLGALLDRAGVADLIARQTSSDDAEESKPDPDIVVAAMTRAGASPDSTVMIGDTPYDVEAALRAGIRIVAVESGGWRAPDLAGAVEVYADASALHARYEQSVFGRLAREAARRPATGRAAARWLAALCLAAGGALLLAGGLTSRRRRDRAARLPERPRGMADDDLLPSSRFADSGILHPSPPRLRRRDYNRLRQVISRTS